MATQPTFELEKQYWEQGIDLIAGVDEAGMGAWAGPVVAAAVVFAPSIPPNPPLSRGALASATGKNLSEVGYVPYRKRLVEPARENRKDPTKAEEAMWRVVLRAGKLGGFSFLRQKPLENFIADLYCPKLSLVIELDGDSHIGNEEYDELRTDKLADYGIKVLRYSDRRVLNNPNEVRLDLTKQLKSRSAAINTPLDKGGLGGIKDSKSLTPKQREEAAGWIRDNALAWAVGEASVEEITELNIRGASHLAMRRAVDGLMHRPDLILLDGTPAQPHPDIPAVNVIKGDSISVSIAAASILAKTHRDRLMIELDKQYPGYGFASHKGYGAPVHKEALQSLGVTPHHRPTYAPVAALLA